MKRRIALWASAGALVVICWTLYISATFSNPLAPTGVVSTLVYLTCPIALAHRYALSFYFVFLANAATYALVGLIIETHAAVLPNPPHGFHLTAQHPRFAID
jgi:hypothetical protein